VRQGGRVQQSALEHLARTARVLSGRPIDAKAREQFSRYLELLLLWNRAQNLTGLQSPPEIVRGLFEDSLLFLPLLPGRRPLRVVDIGAGAGIPGMPLRIIDERIEMTLIESKRKRVSFLKTLRRELGLEKGVVVEEGRAEALVSEVVERGGPFDVAVARAVGNLEQVVPTALQYLKPGGVFIVSAPPPARLAGLGAESHREWQILDYPAIGLKRGFFVAQRSP
jgi:16S rRNA (guanine527-N7)-methyltransferase